MQDNDILKQMADIVKAASFYDKLPLVWKSPGYTDWKWDKRAEIYLRKSFSGEVKAGCLGDRYFYFTKYDGGIRGSTSDNWNGYFFDYDLKRAIEWAKNSNYSDLKWYLWSGLTD